MALVVKNWGASDVKLLLNGKPVSHGTRYRIGRRGMVNASDLVVWIGVEADRPLQVALVPR